MVMGKQSNITRDLNRQFSPVETAGEEGAGGTSTDRKKELPLVSSGVTKQCHFSTPGVASREEQRWEEFYAVAFEIQGKKGARGA